MFGLVVAVAATPESQRLQEQDRVAFPAARSEGWNVLPLAEDGLLLVGEADDGWQASRYDTDFAPLWNVRVPEGVEGEPIEVSRQGDEAWVLFQKGKGGALVGLALADGASRVLPLQWPRRARAMVGFETLPGEAWIATSTAAWGGLRGTLLSVDLRDGAAVELRAPVDAKWASLQRLSLDPVAGAVEVAYHTTKKRRRTQHLAVARDGALTADLSLAWDEANPLTIQRQRLADGSALLVGTYADEPRGPLAQGLYVARVDASGQVGPVARHSFATFAHFFDHLPGGRQERIAARAEKKAERGKELDLDVLFDVHDAYEEGDLLVLCGEAFQPVYQTQVRTTTQVVNGVSTTTTTTTLVFAGWRFTHAAAAAFRGDGTLAWDVSIPMGNIQSARIERHVETSYHDGELTMIYVARGKAFTRSFRDGEVVEDRSTLARMGPEEESEARGALSNAVPWHGGEFLAWGYQKEREDGKVFAFERVTRAE